MQQTDLISLGEEDLYRVCGKSIVAILVALQPAL